MSFSLNGSAEKCISFICPLSSISNTMLMTGFIAELPEGEFSLSDELITAHWFDENEVRAKFNGSSVCDRLFDDIKGEKL